MEEFQNKKLKRALLVAGITAAVYFGFRFMLPLVLPFFAAYWLALMLRPLVVFLKRRLHIKESIAAVTVTGLFSIGIGWLFYWLIIRLFKQFCLFVTELPVYLRFFNIQAEVFCGQVEKCFGLKDGVVISWLCGQCDAAVVYLEECSVKYVMGTGVPFMKWIFEAGAVVVILIVGTILILLSMESIGKWRNTSLFREEIQLVTGRMAKAAGVFLRTQLVIMLLTSIICVAGLTLMGNPFALLAGVGIGLLDMLPLFGTGTVFIPWILITLFAGKYMEAAGLATIYLICYFLREVMEAKLMGQGMGISPLESLISLYVGLKLFGIAGFILGPAGLLIIKELVQFYEEKSIRKKGIR